MAARKWTNSCSNWDSFRVIKILNLLWIIILVVIMNLEFEWISRECELICFYFSTELTRAVWHFTAILEVIRRYYLAYRSIYLSLLKTCRSYRINCSIHRDKPEKKNVEYDIICQFTKQLNDFDEKFYERLHIFFNYEI